MQSIPKIHDVRALPDLRLMVLFRNGEQRLYNCRPLLSLPAFELLANPVFFKAVRVDAGGYGISWNDDVDLSEYELWTNGEAGAQNT